MLKGGKCYGKHLAVKEQSARFGNGAGSILP